MSSPTDKASEPVLASAAAELCEHALTPKMRFQISLMTILFTATLTSVATLLILLVTWQFSFALLGTIWLWAGGLAAIFYWGQIPRLFGFASVSGAFEDSHQEFIEGPLTQFAKTNRFRPKAEN